jgi:8-oxo-dGTP diphosphatase
MEENVANYDPSRYDQPSVTIEVVIFALQKHELCVLLVKPKYWPIKARWALPGSSVNLNESLEQAARRELEEKTGVRAIYLEQLYTFGEPKRKPYTRVINVVYIALVNADKQTLRVSDESTDVGWFSLQRLPGPLAFDHDTILATGLQRLRSKLEYITLASQLLPEVFSIRQLKQIYKMIFGEENIDSENFQRKIKNTNVLEDSGMRREGRSRSTTLYRFRRDWGERQFVFGLREDRLDK